MDDPKKVLVVSAVDYEDTGRVSEVLDKYQKKHGIRILVYSSLRKGADRCASWWAAQRGVIAQAISSKDLTVLVKEGRPDVILSFLDGEKGAQVLKGVNTVGITVFQIGQRKTND